MKNLKILQQCCRELLLTTIPLLLLCSSFVLGEPGYLDFDNLPETKFTCAGKVIGGYYADLETSCQMFHVCTIGQLDEPMDIKFLCLNGTVFDQETRVCERVDEVDCSKSEKYYYLNLELYGNTMVPMQDEETSVEPMIAVTTESFASKIDKPPMEHISITRIKTTMHSNNIYTTTNAPQLPKATQPLPQEAKQTQSTGKPVTGHTFSRIHPSYQLNQNNQQPNQYSFSSTHNPNDHINNSYQNSNKKEQQMLENEEYEYDDEEDDTLSTAGYLSLQTRSHHDSEAQNLHKSPQHQPFPQNFIYQQQLLYNNNDYNNLNNNNSSSNTNHSNDGNNNNHNGAGIGRTEYTNSAISFQQQQLQNGDPLPVTVTTHSVGYTNLVNSGPNQKEQQLNEYGYDSQIGSKQISLLPSSIQHQFQSTSEYPGLHLLPPLRLRGHGFQFAQQDQSKTLNGYGKSSPQIPLHLPFEHNRSQNQLLGFENNSADDLVNVQKERKDLKRSDILVTQPQLDLQVPPTTASFLNLTETKIRGKENKINQHQLTSGNSNIKNNYKYHDTTQIDNFRNRNNNSTNFNNSQNGNIYSVNSSNISIINYNIYDKVLLTPQNRYIPTLPKIIITASASVSDASGKKLNYSLGNVLGQTIKIAPSTYDEYKEEDVALDPFFLDVPKIRPKIANRK